MTYFVANFGAKILLLIIYPAYTYVICPEELGTYDLIISTLSLVYPIIIFSINEAVFRWLLDETGSKQIEIIAVALKITLRNIAVFDILFLLIQTIIQSRYGWYILGVINAGAVYPVLQQIARGLRKNRLFAVSGLLYAVMLVLSNAILVFGCDLGVEGLLLSQLFAYMSSCIFLILSIKALRLKWWRAVVSQKTKAEMTRYSLMLIPNSCCWWIMNASDRYLIRFFLGNAANGIYAIAHKFPSVLNIVTTVFSFAWQEQAITEYASNDRNEYYSRIYRYYYLFLFSICLLLLPITKLFVIFFVESDYSSAWQYSAQLYLGSIFLALASFLGTGYLSAKNTAGSMLTSIAGAIVNIISDLILLPLIGLEAAAISTALGNVSIWMARWIQTGKYFKIRMNWPEFVFLIALNIIWGFLIRYTTLLIDLLLIIIAVAVIFFVNKDLIQNLLKKK